MSIEYNTEKQLIQGVIDHGVDILEFSLIKNDLSRYIDRVLSEKLDYPIPRSELNAVEWFMPQAYKEIDIEQYLVDQCPESNYDRLTTELQEYRRRNLLDLLRQMKYIVDTLRKNNIVWGIGRGSSVASYVLFLLGVHKVDSVKYNLPLEEFFKGGENDN
jgi:DNA polymerase III alpha subunit